MMHLSRLKAKSEKRSVGELPQPLRSTREVMVIQGINCYGVRCLVAQHFAPLFLEDYLVLDPLYLSQSSKMMIKVNFFFKNIPD